MKDLQLIDLKGDTRLFEDISAISVYRNGFWAFVFFPDYSKKYIHGNTSYYKVKDTFGLHSSGAFRPSKPIYRGDPGDYLAIGQRGMYSLVTKKQYEAMFPKEDTSQDKKEINSNSLKDPNFLTSVVKNYDK